MASTAAMTIWAADPGSLMGCHQRLSGSTTVIPGASWTAVEPDESVRQVSRVSPVSISLPIPYVQFREAVLAESNEISS